VSISALSPLKSKTLNPLVASDLGVRSTLWRELGRDLVEEMDTFLDKQVCA